MSQNSTPQTTTQTKKRGRNEIESAGEKKGKPLTLQEYNEKQIVPVTSNFSKEQKQALLTGSVDQISKCFNRSADKLKEILKSAKELLLLAGVKRTTGFTIEAMAKLIHENREYLIHLLNSLSIGSIGTASDSVNSKKDKPTPSQDDDLTNFEFDSVPISKDCTVALLIVEPSGTFKVGELVVIRVTDKYVRGSLVSIQPKYLNQIVPGETEPLCLDMCIDWSPKYCVHMDAFNSRREKPDQYADANDFLGENQTPRKKQRMQVTDPRNAPVADHKDPADTSPSSSSSSNEKTIEARDKQIEDLTRTNQLLREENTRLYTGIVSLKKQLLSSAESIVNLAGGGTADSTPSLYKKVLANNVVVSLDANTLRKCDSKQKVTAMKAFICAVGGAFGLDILNEKYYFGNSKVSNATKLSETVVAELIVLLGLHCKHVDSTDVKTVRADLHVAFREMREGTRSEIRKKQKHEKPNQDVMEDEALDA